MIYSEFDINDVSVSVTKETHSVGRRIVISFETKFWNSFTQKTSNEFVSNLSCPFLGESSLPKETTMKFGTILEIIREIDDVSLYWLSLENSL